MKRALFTFITFLLSVAITMNMLSFNLNVGLNVSTLIIDTKSIIQSIKEANQWIINSYILSKKSSLAINVKDFGAKGDGVTDDTVSFKNAITALKREGGGRLIIPKGFTFNITSTLYITGLKNVIIEGGGTIYWGGPSGGNDVFNFQGNAKNGMECKNIIIKDITINNAAQFGIQIFGAGFTYSPHDFLIENVTTMENFAGGIFINTAHDIKVIDCKNIGGFRHVGIGATKNFTDVYNILVKGCSTFQTSEFGYQSYYGNNIAIIGCKVDGSQTTSGDKSCITIDRSKNVKVENNFVQNAYQNIFMTGVKYVYCSGNTSYGGTYGIQVFYNNETIEDKKIKEAFRVNVTDNYVYKASLAGIIFNGVIQSSISRNVIRGVPSGKYGIYLMESTRTTDKADMRTKQIHVFGNLSDGDIFINTPRDPGVMLIGNKVPTIIGISEVL